MPEAHDMKVSIITVVRNDPLGLARSIASVRGQSHQQFEFIVIDGASHDGTVDVIRKNEDIVDYWESRADNGIYDAMNKGLRHATSQLVLFLNAGDEFLDGESLATAVRGAEQSPEADILRFRAVREDSRPAGSFGRHSAILFESVGNHQATLIRTDVHKRFPFDTRYRIKADRDVQLRMYLAGCHVESIPKFITRFESGGISSTAIPSKEWENVLICWNNRVGLRWTLVAVGLAAARLTVFGFTRLSGLNWTTTKLMLEPSTLTNRYAKWRETASRYAATWWPGSKNKRRTAEQLCPALNSARTSS